MNTTIRISIAYIACRLITGKRISALRDLLLDTEVDLSAVVNSEFIREFDDQHRDYLHGYASDCTYRYTSSDGPAIDIFINDRTFIVHVCGSKAYFIGNLRSDKLYLYDHHNAEHLRFHITAYADQPVPPSESVSHPARS